jgi:hypothetical protein
LFICNIEDLEIPLGFEMHADAFGLNVSYETTEDTAMPFNMTATSFKQSVASGFNDGDAPFSVKSGSVIGGGSGGGTALQKL